MPRLLADPDPAVAARAFAAMRTMVKLDIAALERAAACRRHRIRCDRAATKRT